MHQKIHLIAIGGAAMHNLALALRNKGFEVSGSDDEIFEPSYSRLKAAGILPETMGWHPEKIDSSLDVVILGMHARKDNPELLRAKELGLHIVSYPEYLYEQTKNKKRVVIAGSHGKTTITAMILHVLKKLNKKFDYMVGSQIDGFDTMVALSDDTDLAVFEGDEYLSSPIDLRPKFIHYHPHIGVISGIAWDHINVFPTFELYKEQFRLFIDQIEKDGTLIFCGHDEHVNKITEHKRTDITYCRYLAIESETKNGVTALIDSEKNKTALKIFGQHNMQNISAAKEVCLALDISEPDFHAAIASFSGTKRRLELVYSKNNSFAFYDFAHSPSKVSATVKAVKNQFTNTPVVACFELHTFSSLNKAFLEEYKGCLNEADVAIVYYNKEVIQHKKLENFTKEEVLKAFNKDDLLVFTSKEDLQKQLETYALPNVFLFMSSGNFGGIKINEYASTLINKL